jgi:hypothetical protein
MTTDLSPFARLKLHIERHKYTKGRHAGEAPADTSRRAKTHFRVVQRTNSRIDIVFHSTSILRTSADSPNIVLDSGGWHASPTTREALRDAVYLATQQGGWWVRTHHENGYSQTAVAGYAFYDGMEFDPEFRLVSPPQPFKAYRADREANKAFLDRAKDFRAMLPVLHTAGRQALTADVTRQWITLGYCEKDRVLRCLDTPELWPLLAGLYHKDTHQQTWQAIYKEATQHNKIVVEL